MALHLKNGTYHSYRFAAHQLLGGSLQLHPQCTNCSINGFAVIQKGVSDTDDKNRANLHENIPTVGIVDIVHETLGGINGFVDTVHETVGGIYGFMDTVHETVDGIYGFMDTVHETVGGIYGFMDIVQETVDGIGEAKRKEIFLTYSLIKN
jgi:hypothetical protein